MDHMNNLADLKEQIQEDIITFCAVRTGLDLRAGREPSVTLDELCQIVVDRFKELENSLENS
jgi:hypothetical protein